MYMINICAIREKHINIIVLIFATFPLIPNAIKGFPVILLFIAILLSNIKKQTNWKWLLINSSLYLIYLFSLIYTQNFKIAFTKLETSLSILIIPIIFNGFLSQYNLDQKTRINFFKFFIFTTFCFSTISLFFIVLDNNTVYYLNWYTDKFRSLIIEVPLIGQHPIYASIFLSLSVIFFIELIKKKSIKKNHQYVYLLFVITNILLLLMLVSKGVIIGLLLVCFVDILQNLKNIKLTIIIILAAISFVVLNRRVKEVFNIEMYSHINENFSTSIRVGIYECAFKVIGEKWVLGYGIGDSQRALNLCYSNKSNILLKNRFNSHNQYLDVIIKTGLLGFIIFIYFLVANFKKAYDNKNRIVFNIIFFYCLIFLIENVLVRQSGVILFFFLLIFLNHTSEIVEIEKNEETKSY